jgi:hypothetical protein
MKKYIGFVCFLVFSCSNNPETYIEHINGYWEIEKVTFEDGAEKEYKFNETIDYISINDSLTGYRKKLKPGINNTYYKTSNSENLSLKIENGDLYIYYNTPYANWKEIVIEASPSHLKIINQNKAVYLYKRYIPIQLDIE